MFVLRTEDLRKSFGGLDVLTGITFAAEEKENIAVIGPNGAGKTNVSQTSPGGSRWRPELWASRRRMVSSPKRTSGR